MSLYRLAPSEEHELVNRHRAGCPDAASLLVAMVERFVWKVAHSCHERNPSLDFDDLASAGFAGVMRAMQFFDCSSGVRWFTYSGAAVKKEVWRYATKALRSRIRRREERITSDMFVMSVYPSEPPLIDRVRDALTRLDPITRTLIESKFGIDRNREPLYAVAKRLGIRESDARLMMRAGFARLREEIEDCCR